MKNTRNKIIILAGMLVLLIGSGVFAINQFFTAGINASEALSIRANKETVLVDEKFDITLNEQGTLQTDSEQLDSSEPAADTDSQADEKVLEKEIASTKIQLPIGLEFDAEKTKQLNEQSDKFTANWDSDTRTIEIKWLEYQTKNELILALEAKTPGTYELEAIRQFNDEKETSEKLMIQVKELLQDSTAPVVEESIVNKSTDSLVQPVITRQTRAVGVDEPPVASEGTVANVTDQATFIAAMKDTNVTQINLMNDILITSGLTNQLPGYALGPAMRNGKTLVVEGDYDGSGVKRLDFQGLSMQFYFASANQSMNLVMRNLKLNGTNYYGPFSNYTNNVNQNNFNMYYHNVDYTGSQLTASYASKAYFSGDVKVDTAPSYVSLSGATMTTQDRGNLYKPDGTTAAVTNQQNMEAGNVTFMENAHFWGRTTGSANFHVYGGGNFDVGKNAVIDLEVGGPNQWGESGSTNGWPAVYLLAGAEFRVRDGAKVNITTNKTTGIQSTGRGGIGMENNAKLIVESGAELNIDLDKTLHRNYNGAYGDAIRMGTGGSVLVQSGGKLNLAMSNISNGYANASYLSMINMTGSGSFNVEDGGSLTMKRTGTTSTIPYNGINVQGAGGSVLIGRRATLDAELDGAGISNVINMASGSTFNFSDAESVDLRLTNTNTASRLISMNGTLNVDIQNIMAWNRGQDILNETAARQWNPMYGIKTVYSGGNVTSTTGNSITSSVTTDFQANFRTQNFTRLKFAFIPDVDLVINRPLTDNKTNTSSHVITGIAYPGAFIRLSLVDASGNPVANQSLLPTATIPSQIESEQSNVANNFHTNADSEGNWSVSLPAGSYLEAGMRIKGYGFLNGKDASDTALVLDRTAPDAPVLNPIKDQDATITGTAEVGSTVRAYSIVGDIQLGSDVIADSTGKYTITIPADKRPLVPYLEYYTTSSDHATDEEGNATPNTSTKSNLQAVVDTTPPTADPNPKEFNLADGPVILDQNPQNYVKNILDNQDPIPGKTFSFEFVAGKGPDQIDTTKIGGHSVVVRVFDQAKNYIDVTVGISIIDDSVVSGVNIFLKATDFSMIVPEFNDLTTTELLHAELIKRSQAVAWNKVTGAPVQTEIGTDGGISGVVGSYNLSVRALDVTPATYLSKSVVGTVTGGTIEFFQAPKDVDFGSKEISSRKKVYTPTEDVSMIIEDSRGKTANWELYLKVGKDLTLDSNEAISLPGALRFVNSSNEEVEINDQSGLVHSQTGSLSPMKTTVSWNRSLNQGLLLRVNPGQATKGSYTGELVWTLMDTAENEKSSSATTPD